MARVCEICGKGPLSWHRVSHAHNLTNRKFNVNLSRVRAVVKGRATHVRACTACIKGGKVEKAR